jgi:poly-gamma-glutamate synthesis protein (capsule biosynthesis protein)
VRLTVVLLACLPATAAAAQAANPAATASRGHTVVSVVTPGAPTAPVSVAGPVSVTVALTGDVLVHNTVWQAAAREAVQRGERARFDFRPLLAPIRPIIAGADLALCHLETPLAPAGGPYSGYPLFSTPAEVATALRWTGYDACSTGSNHSVDQGAAGLLRTLWDLDRVGLRHTGTGRTAAEARQPVLFDVDGLRIGWLEYTWGTNGLRVPGNAAVNLADPGRILRDARRARRLGADAVLVGLHWGEEYRHAPSAAQLELARRLARSPDITVVYGHHAHVVQPIRRLRGTWVLFGLGNLLADQATIAPGVDHGLIGLVTLTRGADGTVRVTKVASVPTVIDTTGALRVRPIAPARVAEP